MAEADHDLFTPTDREGRPLTASATVLLLYLWTWVPTKKAKPYRHREHDVGRAPRVRTTPGSPCSTHALAERFGVHLDTIRAHLRQLRHAGYVLPDGDKLALLDRRHRDAYLRALGGASPERSGPPQPPVVDAADRELESNVKDDVALTSEESIEAAGRSHDQITDEIAGESIGSADGITGIARSDRRDRTIKPPDDPLRVQLGPIGSNHFVGEHAPKLCVQNLPGNVRLAIEIVSRLEPPEGAARLPATPHGVRYFAQALSDGTTADELQAVLAAAPDIVAAGLQDADWYTPEMAIGERWSRWRNAYARLAARQRRQQSAPIGGPPPPRVDVAAVDRALEALGLGGAT